jgi:uncharacterized protein
VLSVVLWDIKRYGGYMKVTVHVKPSSKKGAFVQPSLTGELLVHVKEPAQDGKANAAIIKLLAKYYETTQANIKIVRGHTSKTKLIEIQE